MNALVLALLIVLALILLAVGFVVLQRRRRVGRVIAADTSRLQR